MTKSALWHANVLSIAVGVVCGLLTPSAFALSLGRVTVQSALGEPLRAEIDIPEINADEAASLRTAVASPDAFRAAGLEYNPAVSALQVSLQRRSDGRLFLRLSSDRAINDPFIDLILEANWASGRIVRDYTMLFDPPNLRQPPSPTPTAAQLPPAPAPASRPAAEPAPQPSAVPPVAATTPRAGPAKLLPPPSAKPAERSGVQKSPVQQVLVKPGDTASKIAANIKPVNISLDQMLVSLLRANPDAFTGGNINRLKAGSVLEVPKNDQIAGLSPGEATQAVMAQSKDFSEFRRKLADGAPTSQLSSADRKASGKIDAKVDDRKQSTVKPDKLTLSKVPSGAGGKAAESQVLKDRQSGEAAARVAELSKNIKELGKVGAATTPATTASAAASKPVSLAVPVPAATVASIPKPPPALPATPVAAASQSKPVAAASAVATPVTPSSSSPLVTASASAPASAATAIAAASAPAQPKAIAPAKMASAAKPTEESGLVDELLDNPVVPIAAGGLIALLAGFGFYRARQRKKSTQVDSSFLESRLQPDSFFGASGGQRIDTNEGTATGSSMVYSPSQLDAAGDVDPVAEADVYLAYGRDLQAEEILKEAMRTNPSRIAIHGKLLEIYAKRRDVKAFEVVAKEVFGLTGGNGPEWEQICDLGRDLDSSNSLYQPGGHPVEGAGPSLDEYAHTSNGFATSTVPQAAQPEFSQSPAPVDLDLDLDFSLGDDVAAPAPSITEQTVAIRATSAEPPALDLDFGGATMALHAPVAEPEPHSLSVPDLTLSSSDLSFTPVEPDSPQTPPPSVTHSPEVVDPGMIEFDLGSLSLDLGDAPSAPATPLSSHLEDDPLATKLALAEEFQAIGDEDGARALGEEVFAESSGELKAKAKRFLSDLS